VILSSPQPKAPAPATDGGPRRSAIGTAKEKPPRPVPAVDLPLTRKPVERDGDDYKRMRDAMARRMSGRLSRRAHAPDDARRELRRRARLVQIVALAQAEAERKGRGRLARVWAAWRGE